MVLEPRVGGWMVRGRRERNDCRVIKRSFSSTNLDEAVLYVCDDRCVTSFCLFPDRTSVCTALYAKKAYSVGVSLLDLPHSICLPWAPTLKFM